MEWPSPAASKIFFLRKNPHIFLAGTFDKRNSDGLGLMIARTGVTLGSDKQRPPSLLPEPNRWKKKWNRFGSQKTKHAKGERGQLSTEHCRAPLRYLGITHLPNFPEWKVYHWRWAKRAIAAELAKCPVKQPNCLAFGDQPLWNNDFPASPALAACREFLQ